MMNELYILPLQVFTELATKPIFASSGWIVPPSFGDEVKNVTADLFCAKCGKEKTFLGKAYSRNDLSMQYQRDNTPKYAGFGTSPFDFGYNDNETSVDEMIAEIVLPVDDAITVQLSCPSCKSKVYLCFHIETKSHFDKKTMATHIDEICITKIGEYPNQETSRLQSLSKYQACFPREHGFMVKAEQAFYADLGAGAVVYLRKAYEVLIYEILNDMEITRPSQFRQALEAVDKAANIIPIELKDRAYGLFGEMSDAVHGETEDLFGFSKYEPLRDVFKMILNNIMTKREQEALAASIKLDSQAKRGGSQK